MVETPRYPSPGIPSILNDDVTFSSWLRESHIREGFTSATLGASMREKSSFGGYGIILGYQDRNELYKHASVVGYGL